MKRTLFATLVLVILCGGTAMAQKKDSTPAKQIVEKGAKADQHLGKELEKASLKKPPVLLNQKAADSTQSAATSSKKKKSTPKKTGKKN